MPHSDKAEKTTVDSLNEESTQRFKEMVNEVATIKEKIKLYSGTIDDIRSRCEEELGIAKADLNYFAEAKVDPAKITKKFREVEHRAHTAEDLGYIQLEE
jgi:hypothetical protein